MARGKLITIEGVDGAGKTTLASALLARLRGEGVVAELLREPGGVRVAEAIRELVKDPTREISPRAEALLYAAARAQLVDEALNPLLERGTWVLLDRFVDSSLAYQGAGRKLGLEPIRDINVFATGGLSPDLTLLLSVDPAVGRARSRGRDLVPDRLEREHDDFFRRIDAAYRQLAENEPQRIHPIDAARAPEEVQAAAWTAVSALLADSG
jgi:dTMP kinase